MGIPYYFSYIIQNHTNIISKIKNKKTIDYLFLDSNSIVYDSLNMKNFKNTQDFEIDLINSVIKKIENIVKLINPTKYVFITFDGVPPIAKLSQQKTRRYKTHYQNKLFNKNSPWDTCSITPGTQFMNNLNSKLYNYFTDKNKYILSLSDIPGEGEHKIFKHIRDNKDTLKNKNILIYGMDADLFMLSLSHLKYVENTFLYRETPNFIKQLNCNLDPEENYIIDIKLLAKNICFELTEKSDLNLDIIEDYTFICFLLGNDFLPHFPALNIRINGFDILFELYKTEFLNKSLTENGKIKWSNFKKFITKLAENEKKFIENIYRIKSKQEKKYYPESNDDERENKFNNTPTWERNIEKFINIDEDYWEYRYYYSLFDTCIDKNPDIIKNISHNYLQTLEWTYYYYNGDCINWKHTYNYHYPPLLCDLVKYIPYFDSELVLDKNTDKLDTNTLLAYVLPKQSLDLLNPKVKRYMLLNYSEFYKEDYEFVYAFCKYFWEGHVKFNEFNIDKLTKEITKL